MILATLAGMDRKPRDLKDGWTLITGATSGIGLELAERCAARGDKLILTARDASRLEALASRLRADSGAEVKVFPKDLSEARSGAALGAELRSAGLFVACLINNAGFGAAGEFVRMDPSREGEMIQVNMVSLVELTRAALPGMLERRHGRILNVASMAAFQPGPYMAVYYASKAFVLSFSEALGAELRNSGVTVTALCPGPVRTGFQARAGVPDTWQLKYASMDAGVVAAAGFRGMLRGKAVVVPGMGNRLGLLLVRLSPRSLVTRAMAILQGPRKG